MLPQDKAAMRCVRPYVAVRQRCATQTLRSPIKASSRYAWRSGERAYDLESSSLDAGGARFGTTITREDVSVATVRSLSSWTSRVALHHGRG